MRPPRIIIIALVLLVAGLAVATLVVRRFATQQATKTVVFPGGTRVKLLGAARSDQTFIAEEPWAKPLRKILPARWQGWLPGKISMKCGSNSTNNITVFFEVPAPIGAPMPWQTLVAVDDDGFRYPTSGGTCSSSSAGRTILGIALRGFPRRQKTFRLEFLDANRQVLTQVQVANPLPWPPVEQAWRAQSLPITQTNGDLAVTFVAAREGSNRWGSFFRPQWKFQSSDPRWQNPLPGPLELADAVGNTDSFLSLKETVWQVTATFYLRRLEDFDASDRLLVTNLTLPAPGTMLPLDIDWKQDGVRLRTDGLFGPGTLYITNNLQRGMTTNLRSGWSTTSDGKNAIESYGSLNHFLLLDAEGLSGSTKLELRLTDELGREITINGQNTYRSGPSGNTRRYRYEFAVTNAVESLALEVLVNRPKTFVFYLNPAELSRSGTAP